MSNMLALPCLALPGLGLPPAHSPPISEKAEDGPHARSFIYLSTFRCYRNNTQALSALFVLADQDMLRVGGAVERPLPGSGSTSGGNNGAGGVERFTVVQYR